MTKKVIHECALATTSTNTGLYPMRPDASCLQRFLRQIRKLIIMDLNNYRSTAFFRNRSTMLLEQTRHARSRYYFVIHPFSKLNNVLEVIFFFCWLWSFFYAPIIKGIDLTMYSFYNIFIWLVGSLRFIIIITFFFVGYIEHKKKEIIIDPKRIILHYLKTYFIFDLIGTIDLPTLILVTYPYDDIMVEFYKVDFLTTLLRTIAFYSRFWYFLKVFRRIIRMLKLSKIVYYFLFHVIVISLLIHVFTCMLFATPALCYGFFMPENSWLYQAEIYILILTPFTTLYTECLLVAFCYFFGIAHQKYVVYQPNEEIVLCIIIIVGRLYTLFVIADLLKLFGVVGVSESKYEQYMGQLEEYMRSKNLPEELRIRLIEYSEFTLQKHYFNEAQIINTLSEPLRVELHLFGARRLLEKASVLKNLPRSTLGLLFSHMKSETFLPTDVITKVGGGVENVYFISTGTVAVINSNDEEICHLQDGDEFGFVSLFTSATDSQLYTHVAVETSDIYYMPKRLLIGFLENHQDVLKYFESRVQKRIVRYRSVEENMVRGGKDIMSELRGEKLLERQTKRAGNIQ